MSDPFADYLVVDVVRCVIAAGALLLAALLLRTQWPQWRRRPGRPTMPPLLVVSYTVALIAIVVRRTDSLGTPWSNYIWFSIAILITGFIGVLRRVRIGWRPPWTRAEP